MSLPFAKVTKGQIAAQVAYHNPDFDLDPLLPSPRFVGGSAIAASMPINPSAEEFEHFAKCLDVSSGTQLTPRKPKIMLYKGILTAPKSLSGLAVMDSRVLDLLLTRSASLATEIEEFAACRIQQRRRCKTYKPAGVAVAAFQHGFSDGHDPHPHIHYFLSPAAFHPEHGWRTIWTSPIIENSDLILAREQASLAFETRKLGYDIVRDGNSFRVPHFPPELESWWSSRSNTINTLMIDSGYGEGKKLERKKIARKTRTEGKKPKTADLLSALRESLPVDCRRSLSELVVNSHATNREREILATDDVAIRLAGSELRSMIASHEIVPTPFAEIEVLRALPGVATTETFRAVAGGLSSSRFSRGRHQYFACDRVLQIRSSLPVPDGNLSCPAPSQSALPHDRAIVHVVSSCPHDIVVCEAPNPATFTEEVVSESQKLPDQRLAVLDVSEARAEALEALVTASRVKTNRLILVTGRPRRNYCSVATALVEPTLPGNCLPCLSVRESGMPINLIDQNDPVDRELRRMEEKDLLNTVLEFPPETLIVTQTMPLAELINESRHTSALRGNSPTPAPWYSKVTRQRLQPNEESYAYLHQERTGFPKGTIARARIADDRLELTDPGYCRNDRVESWEESHVCTLLRLQKIDMMPGEPIFAHSANSIPDSPYRPGEIEESAFNQPDKDHRFWTLGYAAPLASLPKILLKRAVVFIDEGHYALPKAEDTLRYHLHNSTSAPIVIELAKATAIPEQLRVPVSSAFAAELQPVAEDVSGPTFDL